jgi:large subunit ribosomal protein L28
MPRQCQVTGKIPMRGNSYAIRGIAKKKKGVGLKVTGIKKRRFNPNLLKKRFWYDEEKRFITLNVTAHGMRKIDRVGINAVVREMRARGQKI